MHAVRAEGKGVIARIRNLLDEKGVKHKYKSQVFTFESGEELLAEVLAIGKENSAWNVHEVIQFNAESELVSLDGALETPDVPVIRMTPEEHAAEHLLSESEEQARQLAEMAAAAEAASAPASAPAVAVAEPSSEDAAAEQARQLAEMAAAVAPVVVAAPQVEVLPATPVLPAEDAAEQARQLAEMAASSPAAKVAPRQAQRTARVYTLAVGFVRPTLDNEIAIGKLESAQSLYTRLNRQARLKDRIHHIDVCEGGVIVDRFPHD